MKNTGIEIMDLLQNPEPLIPVLVESMFVRLQLGEFIAVYLIVSFHETVSFLDSLMKLPLLNTGWFL